MAKSTHDAETALFQNEKSKLQLDLKKLAEDHSAELLGLKEENQSVISTMEQRNESLEKRIRELEVEVKNEDPRVEDLQAKLDIVTKQCDDLEFERDALQEDQETLSDNIKFLTQQNKEIEEENAHFRKVIGIEESFGSQEASNISNTVMSPVKSSPTLFKLEQSPIMPSRGTPIQISSTTKPIHRFIASNRKSNQETSRTPFSEKISRLNVPHIVQKTLDKNVTKPIAKPILEQDDTFDESMFLPDDFEKENTSPCKLNKKSAKKQSVNTSQIFRSNWSFSAR